MIPEFHLFLKNGLLLLIQKESRRSDLTSLEVLNLKYMNNKINQWDDQNPLSFRYTIYPISEYELD